MSRPEVGSVAEELYERIGTAFTSEDESLGWPLLVYCEAIGQMFQDVEDVVRDTDDRIGWAVIFDPQSIPEGGLPWLAQFVGVSIPGGSTEQQARDYIDAKLGYGRGSVTTIRDAAALYLTGNKTVQIRERYDPSNPLDDKAYHAQITTFTDETPDPDAVEAAILAQKPIGMIFHIRVIDGMDYITLSEDYATYADVDTAYEDYQHVADDDPI